MLASLLWRNRSPWPRLQAKKRLIDIALICFFIVNPDELRETLHLKLVTIPQQLDTTQTLPSQTPRGIQLTFLIALLPISSYQSTFHKHPGPNFY